MISKVIIAKFVLCQGVEVFIGLSLLGLSLLTEFLMISLLDAETGD